MTDLVAQELARAAVRYHNGLLAEILRRRAAEHDGGYEAVAIPPGVILWPGGVELPEGWVRD